MVYLYLQQQLCSRDTILIYTILIYNATSFCNTASRLINFLSYYFQILHKESRKSAKWMRSVMMLQLAKQQCQCGDKRDFDMQCRKQLLFTAFQTLNYQIKTIRGSRAGMNAQIHASQLLQELSPKLQSFSTIVLAIPIKHKLVILVCNSKRATILH